MKNIFCSCASSRLPPDGLRLIEYDANPLIEESLKGSMTLRNFRAPGKYSSWSKNCFIGSLAVTDSRIVAYAGRKRQVNLPFDDPRSSQVEFTVKKHDLLSIRFDASLFHPNWSGDIELCYGTEMAESICAWVRSSIQEAEVQRGVPIAVATAVEETNEHRRPLDGRYVAAVSSKEGAAPESYPVEEPPPRWKENPPHQQPQPGGEKKSRELLVMGRKRHSH